MIKLENWSETMHGIFVYVINANCRYEIQVMYHAKDTNILTANASLYYVVGEWAGLRGEEHRSASRKLRPLHTI